MSRTLRSSINCVTVAVVVSTWEVSAVMVIASVTSPTRRAMSTTAFLPTVSPIPPRIHHTHRTLEKVIGNCCFYLVPRSGHILYRHDRRCEGFFGGRLEHKLSS